MLWSCSNFTFATNKTCIIFQTLAPTELSTNIAEQDKIEAILKAFHRLPGQELERLQIDLTQPVTAGTPEAELLFEAWKRRQAELKDAMKNILNAAEYMTNITRTLNGTALPSVRYAMVHNTPIDVTLDLAPTGDASTTEKEQVAVLTTDDKLYLLRQLESLLDDVDNARDFHTIGGWPTLLSHLKASQPLQVRSVAALAVGTAIKNTYDYQLWTLESPASSNTDGGHLVVSGLDLLIEALGTSDNTAEEISSERFELHKRALYALSAAMRGNMDVQDALLQMPVPSADGTTIEVKYVHYLHRLASSTLSANSVDHSVLPPELFRKVWSGAADLLEERAYIRRELAHEVSIIQAALASRNNQNNSEAGKDGDTSAMDAAVQQQVETARTLQNAVLLGDHLINAEWMQSAATVALKYATTLNQVEAQLRAVAAGVEGAEEPELQNSEQVAMHATLRSIFAFVKEALVDTPQLYETSDATVGSSAQWQGQLQVAVRSVLELAPHDTEGTYEALVQGGKELGALIGLLDQGANNAVF